jgi:SpoVK/Ycf46/Vps4 family AAA+-type ATPase
MTQDHINLPKTRPVNRVFDDLAPNPQSHFQLCFYAAVSQVIAQVATSFKSLPACFGQFPFLEGYHQELGWRNVSDKSVDWWVKALYEWETNCQTHLPLRALREAYGLAPQSMFLLMNVGLLEEDARFGLLSEQLQIANAQHRPSFGLLEGWWRDQFANSSSREVLRQLINLGLVRVVNPDMPRLEQVLSVPSALWDALRGEQDLGDQLQFRSPDKLERLEDLILPSNLEQQVLQVPNLLVTGQTEVLIVRGAKHSGRGTLLRAVAREIGYGTLEIRLPVNDEGWRCTGALAVALHAMPILRLELSPGEQAELPKINAQGAIGVTLGKHGGLGATQRSLSLKLEPPDPTERRLHWQRAFKQLEQESTPLEFDQFSVSFRLGRALIPKVANLASTQAALEGREQLQADDVRQALRTFNRQSLETLASLISSNGGWECLAVNSQTLEELQALERRCRHREHLQGAVGAALAGTVNAGVRAMLSGPSGAGKTLAAKLLAHQLCMDVYRLDLSSVINKYIGETEKNLERVLSAAEELDVILLIDEGDALLTNRTNVSNANDRYANLETNYLLQRLESFEGIVLITTNASERIDPAFQRRMDVVIEFRNPDPNERLAIWRLHLPEHHRISNTLLETIAIRCTLSGGQIRNAALHASLLALENNSLLNERQLEAAVRLEYRKAGQVCPLPPQVMP